MQTQYATGRGSNAAWPSWRVHRVASMDRGTGYWRSLCGVACNALYGQRSPANGVNVRPCPKCERLAR